MILWFSGHGFSYQSHSSKIGSLRIYWFVVLQIIISDIIILLPLFCMLESSLRHLLPFIGKSICKYYFRWKCIIFVSFVFWSTIFVKRSVTTHPSIFFLFVVKRFILVLFVICLTKGWRKKEVDFTTLKP